MRRLKRKNIKRFKRFKHQVFQASSLKTDPDFHQDDTFYTITVILTIRQRAGRIFLTRKKGVANVNLIIMEKNKKRGTRLGTAFLIISLLFLTLFSQSSGQIAWSVANLKKPGGKK